MGPLGIPQDFELKVARSWSTTTRLKPKSKRSSPSTGIFPQGLGFKKVVAKGLGTYSRYIQTVAFQNHYNICLKAPYPITKKYKKQQRFIWTSAQMQLQWCSTVAWRRFESQFLKQRPGTWTQNLPKHPQVGHLKGAKLGVAALIPQKGQF